MKTITHIFLWTIIISMCLSCLHTINKFPFNFETADLLLKENKDSLAYILEETINPANLSGKEKADYWYWLTQVHEYQGRSMINDSLINFSVQYYDSVNSPNLANAYRLAACQAYKPGRLDESVERLMAKSIQIAKEANDTFNILLSSSKMGIIYLIEQEHSKAIAPFKTALTLGGRNEKITANYLIGCEYTYLNEKDSSFFYFEKALELINEKPSNHIDEKNLLRNYADLLNYFGDSKKAIKILNDTRLKYPDDNEILFTYAYTWLNLNQLDSAKVYLQKIQDYIQTIPPEDTRYYKSIAFLTIINAIYHTKLGSPAEVFSFFRYADRSYHSWEYLKETEKERIFQQSKLIREQDKLELEKAKQLRAYLLIIILLLTITGIVIYIYQRKLLHKERLIQSAKDHLRQYTVKLKENESIINKNLHVISLLTSQIEDNSELQEQLEEVSQIRENNRALQEQNELLKTKIKKYSMLALEKNTDNKAFEELSNQHLQLQEREKYLTDQLINNNEVLRKLKNSPKFISEEQWYEIVNTINIFFNHFTTRMRTDYPNLTDEDIRYCCLIKLSLSTSAISILMAVSPASVTKRKQRIKEKMNRVNEKTVIEESLDAFLWNS